ncbi:hypothetical protein I7I53_09716 [Histoplasma capsulatum var. duboisii H88]|uniref:Uncharacterized protein n=1 Tax=Ajellomyces capsulatus (strain H88) TaxID=544711 RepID=A0A8A1LAA7_AJEC8|nr:hypothetical protein I7I53_09716 [Histoplasma capsulatum var. duboisii H88]
MLGNITTLGVGSNYLLFIVLLTERVLSTQSWSCVYLEGKKIKKSSEPKWYQGRKYSTNQNIHNNKVQEDNEI